MMRCLSILDIESFLLNLKMGQLMILKISNYMKRYMIVSIFYPIFFVRKKHR